MNLGDEVLLYRAFPLGTITELSDGAALVHFTDDAKVWCATKNLTPYRSQA